MTTKRSMSCLAILLNMLAFLFAAAGTATVVSHVWKRAPQFQVVGPHLDYITYEYVHGPALGLHLRQLNMTLHIALSNRHTPSVVVFHGHQLRVSIAHHTVAVIQVWTWIMATDVGSWESRASQQQTCTTSSAPWSSPAKHTRIEGWHSSSMTTKIQRWTASSTSTCGATRRSHSPASPRHRIGSEF